MKARFSNPKVVSLGTKRGGRIGDTHHVLRSNGGKRWQTVELMPKQKNKECEKGRKNQTEMAEEEWLTDGERRQKLWTESDGTVFAGLATETQRSQRETEI